MYYYYTQCIISIVVDGARVYTLVLFIVFIIVFCRGINSVPAGVLHHFKEAATMLINDKGPEMALCAALACISGFTEVQSRSLLTSEQVNILLMNIKV